MKLWICATKHYELASIRVQTSNAYGFPTYSHDGHIFLKEISHISLSHISYLISHIS